MRKSEREEKRDNARFEQLDSYMRKCYRWRIGGSIGLPPRQPKVARSVYDEWSRSLSARYHRATALHEAGHAVVAEVFFPGLVNEVQLASLSSLIEVVKKFNGEGNGAFVNGKTVYGDFQVSDDDAKDRLLKRIVIILAGIEFQSLEGFEAADIDMTEEAEGGLIDATLREFEQNFTISRETERQILDKVEGRVSELRRDDGVCIAVTEVADKLTVSSPISGSSVRRIVERNCGSELLGRMRARF
jgi:hypothetical protein